MDFTAVVGQQLFFDPNSTSHVVPVEIIDDDNFEKQTESFSATLSTDVPQLQLCLLYTSPSPRDATLSRMPSSA